MNASHARDQGMFSHRSRFTIVALRYNFIAFILIVLPTFYYYNYYSRPCYLIDETITFNLSCAVALLVLLPREGVLWLNVLFNLWPEQPDRYRRAKKVRKFSRLLLCLASKGDNIDAVERTIQSMQGWQKVHDRISFHIVTEEDKIDRFKTRLADYSDIILVSVPKGFSPHEARYKARALEYFRISSKLTSSDWVLHMDEETFVDAYGLETCIDLIERSSVDYAQGYIFYNNHAYWKNWFLTFGDIIRVTDDLGRYQWQANCLGKPLFGVHGSFFLTNGKVENASTWDTNNLVEDYWFAKRAESLGFKYGWIPAIAREQSPRTVEDYVMQRRRWWRGIRTLGKPMASALCLSWTWTLIGQQILLAFEFLQCPMIRIPPWLWALKAFDRAIVTYGFVLSLVVHDLDAGVNWKMIVVHLLMAPVLVPWTSVLEAASLLSAIFDTKTGFDVISK